MEETIKFEDDNKVYGSKNEILLYTKFDAELAVIETFEELKILETKAMVIAELAKKDRKGKEEQDQWGIFRLKIECKKGKWLDERFPKGGDRKSNESKLSNTTLINEGITKEESSNARLINNEPELVQQVIEAIKAEGKKVVTPTLVCSGIRKIKQANKIYIKQELPESTFEIIYCDPPWKYDFAESSNRKIENQYPTMTVEEISKMKLPIIADNALLLMWATAPKLKEALKVIDTWGFEYKTNAVWDKAILGMGYWFRGQHEILLIATKGTFSAPLPKNRMSSVYKEKRGKHSSKPTFYYQWIEKCFPDRTMIELFSRNKYNDKWEVWGNE